MDKACHPLFPSVVKPGDAVIHPGWHAAFLQVAGVLDRPGITALTGPPGIGKTLLLQVLGQRLRSSGQRTILLRGGQAARDGADASTLDVILIDNGDRLRPAMLAALTRHGRPVVVTGPPTLADRLREAGLAITAVPLLPLSPGAARNFLAAQVARAGQPANLLESAAAMRIVGIADGVPRRLQLLAGLSVFVARLAGSPTVNLAHVEQASLIQSGSDPEDDTDFEEDEPAAPPGPVEAQRLPRPEPAAVPLRHSLHRARWALAAAAAGVAMGAGLWLATSSQPPEKLAAVGPIATQAPPPAVAPAPAVEAPAPAPAAPLAPPPVPGPQAVTVVAALALPRALPLPEAVPLHLVLAYNPANPEADRSANALAPKLRRRGYHVEHVETGPVRDAEAVDFYFAEDEPAAVTLARLTGRAAVQLRPASSVRPGTLRIVINPKEVALTRRQSGAR